MSNMDDGEIWRDKFHAKKVKIERPLKPKHFYEFDTKVFQVALDCLENKGKIATGDATICTTCVGVFSMYSNLTQGMEGQQIWECEFCNTRNEVMIDREAISKIHRICHGTKQIASKSEDEMLEAMR